MAALPKTGFSALGRTLIMDCIVFRGLILLIVVAPLRVNSEESTETYDTLYRRGVDAYNSGRWFECAKLMRVAIADYQRFYNILGDCRLKCTAESKTDIDRNVFMDLAFFDIAVKRSDCVRRCKRERMGVRPDGVDEKVEHEMKNLESYHYLQLCAYKLERYKEAVSAAYTYLLAHPDHPQMKSNMVFYRAMPQVKPEYFINLEAKSFQVRYQDGVEAYSEEQYEDVLEAMEEALTLYYAEARRCDALCEGPYDHESLPDHINAIADHYIHVLGCRVECPSKMATFMGREVENFLAEHYNYLQFSYYKVGQLEKACEAVGTFLLLDPTNSEMLNNQDFYLSEDGITMQSFKPREEARVYHERRQLEKQQLGFIKTSYTFADSDLDKDGLLQKKRKILKYEPGMTPLRFGPTDTEEYKTRMVNYANTGINITSQSPELKGQHRVVVDNFITEYEAEKLVELAGMATQGDGYSSSASRSSPHTDFEKFEGMTIIKAAQLAKYNLIPEDLAQLYLSVSEKMRSYLADYWNLMSPLYFHFTHLVCRTALEDEAGYECHTDAEDRILCIPVDLPRPSERNAVDAILYLNDGFEGGNFFFAHRNLSIQQEVEPKKSRMVAFEAGDFHGVRAVTKGRRCALAVWFTMSELDAEVAHREAMAMLSHKHVMETLTNSNLRKMIDLDGIRVVKTEKDLNGPERFAADHLVTKQECEKLIKLANGGGRIGDGYSSSRTASSLSPHTEHEKFAALTVKTAAEAGGIQGDGYRSSARGKRRQSPHTAHEMFEGLTLIRATQLAAEGKVDVDAVELYLDVAEKGRKLVESYFDLKTKLYFDFTHLVCRTALHGENTERTDLSHPVHSDNCILQPDGSCKREPPAYVQRDYSGIIYLNGDFKGGEFFFTHSNLTVQIQDNLHQARADLPLCPQHWERAAPYWMRIVLNLQQESTIKPYRGLSIGFDAGNYHGVLPVRAGQRCAVTGWYTLNPEFEERNWDVARAILKDLRNKKGATTSSTAHKDEL